MTDEIIPVEHQRGGATRLVQRSSVLYIKAEGDYVQDRRRQRPLPGACGLSDLERRWQAYGFVRVHRSYVANLRRAVEIRPELGGGATVVLADGSEIPVAVARWLTCAGGCGCERRPSPHMGRARSPRDELAESTAHGQVYLRRLRGAQLTLSILALVAFGAVFGVLPLALYLLPGLQHRSRARYPGAAVAADRPAAGVFVGIGWLYARRADALDDQFRDLVER